MDIKRTIQPRLQEKKINNNPKQTPCDNKLF